MSQIANPRASRYVRPLASERESLPTEVIVTLDGMVAAWAREARCALISEGVSPRAADAMIARLDGC